jgi:hypothetical protein
LKYILIDCNTTPTDTITQVNGPHMRTKRNTLSFFIAADALCMRTTIPISDQAITAISEIRRKIIILVAFTG